MAETFATPAGSRVRTEIDGDVRADGALVGAARKVETAARRMKERVVSSVGEKTVKELAEDSREWVRDNPGKTILISVGVGALVGYLIGRRR
jgi:ElaB/YqjD/DUF883 family membrane-anchored ribosome-binding protein